MLVILGACSKSDAPERVPENVPRWLSEKIEKIKGAEHAIGTMVYRFEWNSETYYHIQDAISSFWRLDVYDSKGNRVEGIDFIAHSSEFKNEVVIWSYFGGYKE
jgi:hypothetical protein